MTLARASDFSAFLNAPETRAAFASHPYPGYVTAAGGQERCDLYLRLERLAEDAGPLEAHLGFRLPPLAVANASDRARDWRGYCGDRDTALLADIARFGYRFDPA